MVRKNKPRAFIHRMLGELGAIFLLLNHYFVPVLLVFIVVASLMFAHYKYQVLVKDRTRSSEFLPAVMVDASENEASIFDATVETPHFKIPPAPQKTSQTDEAWLSTTDYASDMKPFWSREEEVSFPFIQSEVRARMKEIEQKVLQNMK